jgi:hypothetical protein
MTYLEPNQSEPKLIEATVRNVTKEKGHNAIKTRILQTGGHCDGVVILVGHLHDLFLSYLVVVT